MSLRYDITIRETQALPDGYRWGAHVGEPGWSGYYLIRESDDASCVARMTPEEVEDRSAMEIDDAIRASAEEEEGA